MHVAAMGPDRKHAASGGEHDVRAAVPRSGVYPQAEKTVAGCSYSSLNGVAFSYVYVGYAIIEMQSMSSIVCF